MKKLIVAAAAAAALGALAFWRRKTLKEDVSKAGSAITSAGAKIRGRGDSVADGAEEMLQEVADKADDLQHSHA